MSEEKAPPEVAVEDFTNLVTSEHNQQPRYMQTVALSVQPHADGANVGNSYWTLFDLDTAVGEQEDMLGQWIGLTRFVPTPVNVFFTLDDAYLGFDIGRWKTPYEVAEQIHRLDDEAYRTLLRARVAGNQWDGTIPGAYDVWEVLFKGTGWEVFIQDGIGTSDRYFTLDDQVGGLLGFDHAIWMKRPVPIGNFFSLGGTDPMLGLDNAVWYNEGALYYPKVAITHGNMHLIQAILGPPLDPVAIELFSGNYLGLHSAGVTIDYIAQSQGEDANGGLGRPLFALDAGLTANSTFWCSFDIVDLGLDEAPLFDPNAGLQPLFQLDGTGDESGLDNSVWEPIAPPPGQASWPHDPDDGEPPQAAAYPPVPFAGFDLGCWAWQLPKSRRAA